MKKFLLLLLLPLAALAAPPVNVTKDGTTNVLTGPLNNVQLVDTSGNVLKSGTGAITGTDTSIAVARTWSDASGSGPGASGHGFEDCSTLVRTGVAAYDSFSVSTNLSGNASYNHLGSYQATPIVNIGNANTLTTLFGFTDRFTATTGQVTTSIGFWHQAPSVGGGASLGTRYAFKNDDGNASIYTVGDLFVDSGTTSTSYTTGAVKVTGGVGISGPVYTNDNVFVRSTGTSNARLAVGAASTSTNYSELFLDSGTGSGAGGSVVYAKNGIAKAYVGLDSYVSGGTGDQLSLSATAGIKLLNNTSLTGKLTTYNNITTAGNGVVSVQGANRTAGATGAVASVATYTVGAADASFLVSANVNVTASTTHNFTVTCTYTDETNASRTLTLGFTQLSGATLVTAITNALGTGPYESLTYHIRAKAATAITIATTGTFTTVTYNVEGVISKLQ